MANRWRVFLTPIQLSPTFVEDLTLAALTLHNFLRSNNVSKQIYTPKGLADEEDISTAEVVPGSWRASELQTGFAPFFRNKFPGLFQDFSRPQIEFSRTLKFTLTLSFPRSQC